MSLEISRVVTPLVIGLTAALAPTGFTELSGLTGWPVQSALATAARPDSGQWTTLRQQFEPLVADATRQHVTIGITALNLAAPHEKQNLDIGSMGLFKAASTIKLGLASMIMKGIDEVNGRWTTRSPSRRTTSAAPEPCRRREKAPSLRRSRWAA